MYRRIDIYFKQLTRSILFGLLLFTIVISSGTSVSASSKQIPDEVYTASDSVVHLLLTCTDQMGNTYYVNQGTGFVAGTDENSQYILTSNLITEISDEQMNQIHKWSGLSADEQLNTQLSILLESDILIPTTIVSTGSSVPYTLLTPEQPLKNISAPRFCYSADVTRNQTAYACGYNADTKLLLQTAPDMDATFRIGTISDISTKPLCISSDITAENGCAGAPVFDKNGWVIGMFYSSNGNMEILPSDTLISILDALQINCRTNALNSDYNVADDTIRHELKDLLTACQQDVTQNGDNYSAKTLTTYKDAINTAMEVTQNTASTKDDYQSALDALTKAKSKLKPYNFTLRIVQLILAAVLLALFIINIRQYRNSMKLYQTLHPELTPKEPSRKSAALIRVNSNEVIWLDTRELRIGSDSNLVDYVISDNSAISRYHAAIIQKKHLYYIIDNASTNHTSVNHTILSSGQSHQLNDSDTILLADEPFTFHLMEA